mmetsp:Transcript_77350/g.199097  ORF Transcript_77350/g.199097 Transcript_77350/m.199097 type:complete len:366 (+) Transcript_77350:96-1193(+)
MRSLVAGQMHHSEDVRAARPDGCTYRDASGEEAGIEEEEAERCRRARHRGMARAKDTRKEPVDPSQVLDISHSLDSLSSEIADSAASLAGVRQRLLQIKGRLEGPSSPLSRLDDLHSLLASVQLDIREHAATAPRGSQQRPKPAALNACTAESVEAPKRGLPKLDLTSSGLKSMVALSVKESSEVPKSVELGCWTPVTPGANGQPELEPSPQVSRCLSALVDDFDVAVERPVPVSPRDGLASHVATEYGDENSDKCLPSLPRMTPTWVIAGNTHCDVSAVPQTWRGSQPAQDDVSCCGSGAITARRSPPSYGPISPRSKYFAPVWRMSMPKVQNIESLADAAAVPVPLLPRVPSLLFSRATKTEH